jgi:Mg-chelatase subunit ChlD
MKRWILPVRLLMVLGGFTLVWMAAAVRADDPPAGGAVQPAAPQTQRAKDGLKQRPQIEVCFVLDTTGSMSGLIEGAKQKIWSIANAIIAVRDKPQIKVALIGYRDKGDEYVTRVYDLTDDIDTVYKHLQAFKAGGGGDAPESVNQALNEAVTKIGWSDRPEVTRIIFLVGDAPPHMDYAEDVKYADTCAAARKRDILINAVQCGTMAETTPVWTEIAKLGKGSYIPLVQEGGMVAVATPFDRELSELNARVTATAVAYGARDQQREVLGKVAANAAAPATQPVAAAVLSVAAQRAAYNNTDGGRAVQGRGDLVWDSASGLVKLEDLKPDQLPPELQKMTPTERKAFVEQKRKERDELQSKIAELAKRRDAYVAAEREKMAKASPAAAAFDERVSTVVREQADAKRK